MTIYKLSGGEKGESLVVVYSDGEPASIPGTHPKFDDILTLLRSGKSDDESVKTLVNTLHVAGTKLRALTDRVSVEPYGVFFDGDLINTGLADVLKRFLEENKEDDLVAVANFLENAAANQTMEGIDALYRWLENGDLVITKEGMVLAYKAITKDADGNFVSITSGKALVDGVVHEGQIPNPIGAVVSMPRSEVTDQTSVNCGPGLHAGTHAYATWFKNSGWGNQERFLVLVEFNPRDVVSVPSDHSCAKLRVSKYKVIKEVEERLEKVYYTEESADDDGDFTETDAVDEQPEVPLKDVLEHAFAGIPAPPAPPFTRGESDDDLEDDDENTETGSITTDEWRRENGFSESKTEDLGIDGHESKESKLRKIASWFNGK